MVDVLWIRRSLSKEDVDAETKTGKVGEGLVWFSPTHDSCEDGERKVISPRLKIILICGSDNSISSLLTSL